MKERQHTLELLRSRLAKLGVNGVINPLAQTLCSIIDMFNSQHWHDRDRYDERIKVLEAEHEKLKSRLFKLETKGQHE